MGLLVQLGRLTLRLFKCGKVRYGHEATALTLTGMTGRYTGQERLPRMRERLFRANPHCFWCGVKVELDLPHASANLATVDHLYSRFHPERKTRHNQKDTVLHVLACHSCNHERGLCEMKQQPFIPKLKERLEFAQRADATLALKRRLPEQPEVTPTPVGSGSLSTLKMVQPMRVICTLEEAIKFANENPAR